MTMLTDTNPGQFPDLIGVEHQFFERVGVPQHIVWYREQITVPFVDVVNLLIAGLQ